MSRIRSIHPGLFTDEAFVSLSPMARIFLMGIWTECDDIGLFEWSPLKLKMRILPADSADPNELLAEIESQNCVMKYQVGGKAYGAVRNFCQYQRPKKANAVHPQTPQVLAFVNTEARSTRDGGEPVGNLLPTNGEKSRQMEDGGDKRIDSEANASGQLPLPVASAIDLKKAVFDSGIPLLINSGSTERNARSMLGRWRQDHGDGAVLDALSACTAESPSEPIPWIKQALDRRNGLRKFRIEPAMELGKLADAELAATRSSDYKEAGGGTGLALPDYLTN